MVNILYEPVENIKGVGLKTITKLNDLGIFKLKDVLFNIPTKIESSQELSHLLVDEAKVVAKGIIESSLTTQFYSKKMNKSSFLLQTNIGTIKIMFFNQLYLKKYLFEGRKVIIKGQYKAANNTILANNFIFKDEELLDEKKSEIEIFYRLKKGITNNQYKKIVKEALTMLNNDNNFVDLVPKNFKGIWNLKKILNTLHFPENNVSFDRAKKMFAFHELLDYQLKLQLQNLKYKNFDERYRVLVNKDIIKDFEDTLSFELTNSQKNVIFEIVEDLSKPYKMDRLLQGDVGCGKTVVAAAIIYYLVKNNTQCAVMAPTEILSNQHFETFFSFFKSLDVSMAVLTSSTNKKERKRILELLETGDIELIIGTHSLIQEDVKFKNLKLVIIDEQHRFGVNQRKILGEKDDICHTLMMTATPIPRSLAITLITDIKVSTISELPKGRKKVQTFKATNKQFDFVISNILKELDKGRQGYVVCPLIDESEKLDLQNVMQTYDILKQKLPNNYVVEILHGKMSASEKECIIAKYLKNEIHILISTTVIEVGVNVPNATFMIIVDAHRFGLATLHQLRGRVGRSEYEAYCILITDSKSERIDIMCLENDGFKISEFDLKNRGPGDFFGTKQSGLPSFKVADLINDTELMYLAKKLATRLIEVTDNKEKLISYLGLSEMNY